MGTPKMVYEKWLNCRLVDGITTLPGPWLSQYISSPAIFVFREVNTSFQN